MSDFRFINRCMVWLTLFFMLSAGFYVPTAQAEDRASVTSDNIEMRQGPGDNYNIVTKLNKGAEVIVEGSYDDWLRVTSGADSGWLPAAAVQAAGAPQSAADNDQQPSAPASAPAADTPAAVQQVRVKVTAANLREQPSENGGIIKAVPQGSTIRVTQTLEGWYQVVTLSGQTGYISASVVEPLTSAPASAPAPAPASAAGDISVYVNQQAVVFTDAHPVIVNSRTLVPLRAVMEAVGAVVGWDADKRQVTVTRADKYLIMPVDSHQPTINGQVVDIDVPPQIINNRTFIPVRFVSESLGDQVDWQAENKRIDITAAASPTVPDPLPAPIDESKPGDTPLNPGASLGGDVIGEQHLSSNQLQLSVVNENGGLALIIKAGSSMDPEWSEDKNGFTLKFARGNWVDNIVKKDAMGPGNIYINTKNEAEGCSLQIIYPQAAMYEKQLADENKTLKIYFPNHIYEILEDNYGDYGAKIAVRTLFPAEFTSYDINQGQQLNFNFHRIISSCYFYFTFFGGILRGIPAFSNSNLRIRESFFEFIENLFPFWLIAFIIILIIAYECIINILG